MKTVHKSVLVWYSPEQMYDLVVDVPRYPEFLPWCDRARVLETHPDGVTAQVGLSLGGLRQSFTTRNTHVPGHEVRLKLVKGPFSDLDGVWTFSPVAPVAGSGNDADAAATGDGAGPVVHVADPALQACRIDLKLNYGFDNFALSALVGPVFDKIASTLVDAFVQRAEQVYPKA